MREYHVLIQHQHHLQDAARQQQQAELRAAATSKSSRMGILSKLLRIRLRRESMPVAHTQSPHHARPVHGKG